MKCVVYFMAKVVIFFIKTKNNGFFECEPLKIEKVNGARVSGWLLLRQ